jgi:hypothetical protein
LRADSHTGNSGKLVLFVPLMLLIACTSRQPPAEIVQATPLVAPIVSHQPARGCEREHDTIYLPGVYIDAYPELPPNAEPDHLVLHLSDGNTLWAKPNYGSADCTSYVNCRSATLVLNPAWSQCTPRGIFYEVSTADGGLVLESRLWQITAPMNKATAYVGFACGRGFAGLDFTTISKQSREDGCLSQPSGPTPTGKTLATAVALSATYFSYRAAYDRTVECVTDEWSGTKCY